MSNVLESVSSHIKTLELRKKSNSTANAFATVAYSCEMETDFLRAFVPPVRGDVTFVWESVRNHVIVIRVNEENSYGSILHRLSELVNVTLRLIIKIL